MAAETIEGLVSRINGHGFKIEGREEWVNISRYAPLDEAPMPEVGQRVRITLDKAGFARKIETLEQPRVEQQPEPPATVAHPDTKDQRITRLAVLNTATAILSSGGRAIGDPAEVVKLAAKLEAWVNR